MASGAAPDDQALLSALRAIEAFNADNLASRASDAAADDAIDGVSWPGLEIRSRFGAGSFGQVYRAWDPDLERSVALKLSHATVADPREYQRLKQEARHLAQLRHPNIVAVHGVEEHDGRLGIQMELIEGETLAAVVGDGRTLGADEATAIGIKLCHALAAATAKGLIHSDIKAQNVMRESGGRIVLMDFGAARFKTTSDAEAAAKTAGTPLYMAPELFDGDEPTQASDIYALGVLLFHLVTHRFPVEAASVRGIKEQHQRFQRILLRDIRPDLPEEFVRVVEQALARAPGARHGTAGQFERELADTLPTDRSALQRRLRAGAIVAGTVAGLTVLGFLETRAFQLFLDIPEVFMTETPLLYLRWGVQAMVPILAYWVVLIVAAAALIAIGSLARRGRRAAPGPQPRRWWTRVDPTAASMTVFAVGALVWLGITWLFSEQFGALTALTDPDAQPDFTLLRDRYELAREQAYASLSLGLAVAVWRLFPRGDQAGGDRMTTRIIRGATVSLCALSVALAVLPYRVLWTNYPMVTVDDQTFYVLAENGDARLLYNPHAIDSAARSMVVSADDTRVQPAGTSAGLFEN